MVQQKRIDIKLILLTKNRFLLNASHNGHLNIVEFLVSHGANVNAKNNNNETPLHIAWKNGHKDIVEYLVSHGANVTVIDKYEKTLKLREKKNKIYYY